MRLTPLTHRTPAPPRDVAAALAPAAVFLVTCTLAALWVPAPVMTGAPWGLRAGFALLLAAVGLVLAHGLSRTPAAHRLAWLTAPVLGVVLLGPPLEQLVHGVNALGLPTAAQARERLPRVVETARLHGAETSRRRKSPTRFELVVEARRPGGLLPAWGAIAVTQAVQEEAVRVAAASSTGCVAFLVARGTLRLPVVVEAEACPDE